MTLSIDGLDFSFGETRVVRDVSLDLAAGRLCCLLGANGSGKSTVMRCLAGILQPHRGRVSLDGADLLAMSARRRAQRVSHLPQRTGQPALTVFETVALGLPRGARSREPEMLARVERAIHEVGLDEEAMRPLTRLSGGQAQRAHIARTLLRDSRLILLDEPVSSLDLRYQVEVMQLLRDLARARQAVVLVIVHDVNLAARFGDEIVLLHEGRILGRGSPQQVLQDELLEQAYRTPLVVREVDGQPVVLPGAQAVPGGRAEWQHGLDR